MGTENWKSSPFKLEQFRDVQLENLLTFLINEIINSFPIYLELKEVRDMDTFFLTLSRKLTIAVINSEGNALSKTPT